ncbi:hypothetical protein [Sedimentitalea todarodis]|uniref:Uncharacterized protein n=1 Tax=Sedimentitalea todarodis TaxID=1631240 RepID=A0ABU3VGH0_9RHOB|nr:hypothetical protein [Sedimentitalea todarodis]MDU9005288.1 hypothetical protein [Sedimentitalea todarodis]
MGLKKYAAKLDDYFTRLKRGKAGKIKPDHVEKVIAKLRAKAERLQLEIKEATKESKKARLERKVLIANEQIRRAQLLLKEIDSTAKPAAGVDTKTPDT